MIWHILLGVLVAHVAWAAFFVGWWWHMTRGSTEKHDAINKHFKSVREAIRQAAPRN